MSEKSYMDADDHPLAIIIMALLQRQGEPFKATFTPAQLNDPKLGMEYAIEYSCLDEGTDAERFTLRLVRKDSILPTKDISDE